MATTNPLDAVREIETYAGRLFERISRMHGEVETALKETRKFVASLKDKEKAQEEVRRAQEREERLKELFNSQESSAVHVGGKGDDELVVEATPKAKTEAINTETAKTEEPEKVEKIEKPEPLVQIPQVEEKPADQPTGDEVTEVKVKPEEVSEKPEASEKAEQHDRVDDRRESRRNADARRGGDAPRSDRTNAESRQPRGRQHSAGSEQSRPPRERNEQRSDRPQQGARSPQGDRRAPQPGTDRQGQSKPASGGRSGFGTPGFAGAPAAQSGKFGDKPAYTRTHETTDKKAKNKKAKMKETAPVIAWDDDTPMGNRRKARKQAATVAHKPEPVVIEKAVLAAENISVKDLSERLGKPVSEIIKKLIGLGIMANINQEIDFDTAEIVAAEFGITLELQLAKTYEDVLAESSDDEDDPAMLAPRPPVVTIMGHVDHGKTSLLDAIRHSSVTEGEAGGITQHIGAYTVNCGGSTITFIDTPGHEAFTSMRARGAQVTDVVILVVAADDGIMPQTIEAISHSKAAGVPIIVAVNKIDKDTANPERVKQQLTEYGLVCEEWGGDTICVNVSAKQRMGLDSLLEMVLLQADMLELKANPNRLAKGTIIEAELDKGRGPIATVLVQNGTLRVGDPIVAGTAYGRVRAMMDDKGRRVEEAGPSFPVQVLGFSEVPAAGDALIVAELDKLSRQVAEERRDKQKAAQLKNLSKVSLDDLFSRINEGDVKELNIIVKADVQGSVEAVKQALEKLSNEEVRVSCIHGGVGAISSTDIMFASASNAIVIGFNVRPDASARATAEKEKVDMRLYSIIYNAIEDIEHAMKGLFAPQYREVELGHAEVRDVFKVSGVGAIAGSYIRDGKVSRNAQVRVVRDGIVIHEGKIASLRRFKDDVREVATGYECGIGVENFNDIKEGDIIEAFIMEEIKR